MALTDILNLTLNQYDDTDPKWRLFISDHKQYLIGQSNTATISNSYMQGYQYSLRRYLRSIHYNIHFAWIVSLINDIPTDVQFTTNVIMLLIPPQNVLEALYTNYITTNPTT